MICSFRFYIVGFTGVRCETNIDDCVNINCGSGGVCVDGIDTSYCKCPVSKIGPKCDRGMVSY